MRKLWDISYLWNMSRVKPPFKLSFYLDKRHTSYLPVKHKYYASSQDNRLGRHSLYLRAFCRFEKKPKMFNLSVLKWGKNWGFYDKTKVHHKTSLLAIFSIVDYFWEKKGWFSPKLQDTMRLSKPIVQPQNSHTSYTLGAKLHLCNRN